MLKNSRLRVFAGPNGSGKSTLFSEFSKSHDTGYFINADEIELNIKQRGYVSLLDSGVTLSKGELTLFNKTSEAKSLMKKASNEGYEIDIEVIDEFIVDKTKKSNSYESAFIASFIRWLFLKNQKSFSFETVMSHSSKIEEIKLAKSIGYKTYLYFVCTDNVEINVERVHNRVEIGGHVVNPDKIRSRYTETLKNLYPAIKNSRRAYLFDNSKEDIVLIAEIFEGAMKIKVKNPPRWFREYVLPYFK